MIQCCCNIKTLISFKLTRIHLEYVGKALPFSCFCCWDFFSPFLFVDFMHSRHSATSSFGFYDFFFVRYLYNIHFLCVRCPTSLLLFFLMSRYFFSFQHSFIVFCVRSAHRAKTKLLILRIFMLFRVFRCILHFALTHHHHKVLLFLSLFIIIILYFGGKILLGIHFVCVVLQL